MFSNPTLLLGLSGGLFVGLALPLVAKRVKPNGWYGFRVKQTLSDTQIWYKANKAAGVGLLVAGTTIIITALICSLLQQRSSTFPVHSVTFAVYLIALSGSVAYSFWALKNITKQV